MPAEERIINGETWELYNGRYGPDGGYTKKEADQVAEEWRRCGRARVLKIQDEYWVYVQ